MNPSLFKQVPYDPVGSFTPIIRLTRGDLVLAVHPGVAATDARSFAALARSTTALNYASPGNGTPQHLGMELFRLVADVRMNHVPYRGSAPAIQDLIAGRVSAMVLPVHTAIPLAAADHVRLLAVGSPQRSAAVPDVPTMAEAGFPGAEVDLWYGVLGPAGLPAAMREALRAALDEWLRLPATKEQLQAQGMTTGRRQLGGLRIGDRQRPGPLGLRHPPGGIVGRLTAPHLRASHGHRAHRHPHPEPQRRHRVRCRRGATRPQGADARRNLRSGRRRRERLPRAARARRGHARGGRRRRRQRPPAGGVAGRSRPAARIDPDRRPHPRQLHGARPRREAGIPLRAGRPGPGGARVAGRAGRAGPLGRRLDRRQRQPAAGRARGFLRPSSHRWPSAAAGASCSTPPASRSAPRWARAWRSSSRAGASSKP